MLLPHPLTAFDPRLGLGKHAAVGRAFAFVGRLELAGHGRFTWLDQLSDV
jgi:hypothetical protein